MRRVRRWSRRWTWRIPCLWSFSSWRWEWTKRREPACRIGWQWSRPYPPTRRRLAFGIQWYRVTRASAAYSQCKRRDNDTMYQSRWQIEINYKLASQQVRYIHTYLLTLHYCRYRYYSIASSMYCMYIWFLSQNHILRIFKPSKTYPTVTSKMLEPTEEETAMSPKPLRATMTLVMRSGMDVPAAKKVRPIT